MGWVVFPFALIARALVTLQTVSNARLKKALEQALIRNYVVGLSSIALYSVVARVPIPAPEQAATGQCGRGSPVPFMALPRYFGRIRSARRNSDSSVCHGSAHAP